MEFLPNDNNLFHSVCPQNLEKGGNLNFDDAQIAPYIYFAYLQIPFTFFPLPNALFYFLLCFWSYPSNMQLRFQSFQFIFFNFFSKVYWFFFIKKSFSFSPQNKPALFNIEIYSLLNNSSFFFNPTKLILVKIVLTIFISLNH